jgi:phosphoenolpyruvate synthase/pyruvate phosphate dikinase
MEEAMPEAYAELMAKVRETLEQHYRDMQDIEFTVQQKQAVHAADPQRQAHRRGSAAHRGRDGARWG